MKNLFKAIFAMAVFVCASAFATGTSENTHPGANPPGNGWGCADNPGKSDCNRKDGNNQPPNGGGHPGNNGQGGNPPGNGNGCNNNPHGCPDTPNNSGGNGGGGGSGGNGGNGGQGGNGGSGAASSDAAAQAKNWSNMSSTQRQEMLDNMNSQQKADLKAALSVGVDVTNKIDGSKANSSSSAQGSSGNTTTTNVGGTNYNYSQPVAGAFVQLSPGIMSHGTMVVTTTACSGDFDIQEVRKIQATSNVGLGLWTTTRDNGVVSKTSASSTGLVYGVWEVTGSDGDKLVEERTVNGYQAVIYAYLAGSSASSGLALNGQNGAGAVSGSGGIQTFGKEIDKVPCSFKETRRLSPVKSASADDLAGAIAARLSLKQELSAPSYEREFVKCPPEGCKAPKSGYYRYVRKDSAVKASAELGSATRAGGKSETKKP